MPSYLQGERDVRSVRRRAGNSWVHANSTGRWRRCYGVGPQHSPLCNGSFSRARALSSAPATCPPPSPSLAPAPSPLLSGAFYTANAITHHCTGDGSDAKSSPNAKPSQEMPQSPLKTVNTKILQDFDAVEEHWGQHQETKSEIEEREAEELRRVEEEYAAQQAVEQERVAKEEEQQRKRLADEEMEKQAERRRAEKEAARKKKDEETSRQKAVLEPAADPLGLG
jgi:hypothetical protein